jgi:hypothetical protein
LHSPPESLAISVHTHSVASRLKRRKPVAPVLKWIAGTPVPDALDERANALHGAHSPDDGHIMGTGG